MMNPAEETGFSSQVRCHDAKCFANLGCRVLRNEARPLQTACRQAHVHCKRMRRCRYAGTSSCVVQMFKLCQRTVSVQTMYCLALAVQFKQRFSECGRSGKSFGFEVRKSASPNAPLPHYYHDQPNDARHIANSTSHALSLTFHTFCVGSGASIP